MPKTETRNCKKHGDTKFSQQTDSYWRCCKCRSDSVTRWRQRTKQKLVAYKGGSCECCGYNKCIEALEFHHVDGDKEFGIGAGSSKALSKLKKEVDKCELLCANCH